MDDLVTHPYDLGSGDRRVLRAELGRHAARSLAQGLDELGQRQANVFVGIVLLAIEAACSLGDLSSQVHHLADVDEVVMPHTRSWPRQGLDPEVAD